MSTSFPFDPQTDPTLPGHPDPYPIYHQLRALKPVYWSPAMNGWVLLRYADAVSYLNDRRFSRQAYLQTLRQRYGDSPILESQQREIVFSDPPQHKRLRRLAERASHLQDSMPFRPQIERLVNEKLTRFQSRGEMDLIADLAEPLPPEVLALWLGVPLADVPLLKAWVLAIQKGRGIVRTPETTAMADRAVKALETYFEQLIAERRSSPRGDAITSLSQVEEHGDRLSDRELLMFSWGLFAAGHTSVQYLIGNTLLALLRHPDQLEKLRSDRTLIASSVEEALRYDPPTQALNPQVALEEVTVGDETIKEGEAVSVLIGAVNRDPERFPDPDRFDITRSDRHHLSFSTGEHFCLGSSLARLQAQIALELLLQRLSNLKLATEKLEWQKLGRFRGLVSLPVTFTPC
jgi:pimeloyl-[acyl-carrier protein] synthase